MPTPEDQAHLKTLSICWYIYAGLNLIGTLCGGLYTIIGVIALATGEREEDIVMGGVFTGMGLVVIVLTLLFAVLFFLTAKGLANQTRKTLIYICAVIACLNVPLGTVLGVFTFIVMGRPTVKEAFDAQKRVTNAFDTQQDYVR